MLSFYRCHCLIYVEVLLYFVLILLFLSIHFFLASQSSGASIHLYEKFRERAQNTNSCPLCLRAFFADTELLALLNDTSKKIKKLEGDDIKVSGFFFLWVLMCNMTLIF